MWTFVAHFWDQIRPFWINIRPYWTILDHVDLRSSVVTNISSYDPHTHTYLTFLSGYLVWTRYPCVSVDQISMCICRPDIYGYLSTRYPCVSVDQIFMGVCRPDIYGCLSTRYLWIFGDQISMSICDSFFFARRASSC